MPEESGYKMYVVPITPQKRDALVNIAMSACIGVKCPICGKEFTGLADLHDSIWAGKAPAHGRCWEERGYMPETWSDGTPIVIVGPPPPTPPAPPEPPSKEEK